MTALTFHRGRRNALATFALARRKTRRTAANADSLQDIDSACKFERWRSRANKGEQVIKHWLQTWLVHMRHPIRLWREMGTKGFLALQVLIGGSLLSALVHPIFMWFVALDAWSGELFTAGETVEHTIRKVLAVTVLCVGYLGTIALGIAGLRRRRMLGIGWVLLTVPIYWLFLSYAAWRALFQILHAPYKWEKTQHGLARSSLRTARLQPVPAMRPVREFAAERLGRTGTAR